MFSRFRHPVVLLPGDNEWTDCHRETAGSWKPLERLARLRALFFTPPGRVLGGGSLALVSQAADPARAEFPEHVRWSREGVVFVALHIVGSRNARAGFPARTRKTTPRWCGAPKRPSPGCARGFASPGSRTPPGC